MKTSTIPPEYRNPIYHYRGPSDFPSPWTLTDEALKNYGVTRELFGSTTIVLSADFSFNVKDYQYALATNAAGGVTSVGMYLIPVSNDRDVMDANGNSVPGWQIVDDMIRQKLGLKPDDHIFTLISYMHPELNKGTLEYFTVGEGNDKIELGFTHLGAYIGKGTTSISPAAYHQHRFGCQGLPGVPYGYPCNVHLVRLANVDQAVFNWNCQLVDLMMGHGVEFPGDYKNSKYRPVYINAALMFYRDWLRQEDYLLRENSWYTYCAVNKLNVLNVACNLPHNEDAFKQVYGADEGAALWKTFLERYRNATGFDFYYYKGLETHFTPLWQQEGLTPAQITPFTLAEYEAYDAHHRQGTPYNGPAPVLPPKGMVCNPQTTADVVFEFEQLYADLYDAGALTSIGVLWGFMPAVIDRTGISELEYLRYTILIFQKLIYADARVYAPAQGSTWQYNEWFWQSFDALYLLFGGTPGKSPKQDAALVTDVLKKCPNIDALLDENPNPQQADAMALAAVTMEKVIADWDTIMSGPITREDAYVEFMISARKDFEEAGNMIVTNPDKIEYNALPAIINLMANGLYAHNERLSFETICTAVDITEIQLK